MSGAVGGDGGPGCHSPAATRCAAALRAVLFSASAEAMRPYLTAGRQHVRRRVSTGRAVASRGTASRAGDGGGAGFGGAGGGAGGVIGIRYGLGLIQDFGNTPIHDQHFTEFSDHDVGRFEVAMHDAAAVDDVLGQI